MNKWIVTSPFDQKVLGEIPLQSDQEVENALAIAYGQFEDRNCWLTKVQRISILEKAREIIISRQEELAQKSAEEGGKPLIDSRLEIARAASGIKCAVQYLETMGGEEIPMQINPASTQRVAFTFFEPRGVVLAISAFNHPFNLIIHQVAPALAVGCPVLVKPSQRTPLSCQRLIEIFYEAGLPKAWCHMLTCSNENIRKLVSDPRVRFLTFIGSSKVGWMLRSQLAPGAHCALEHGGAAPVIIEQDADLSDAIPILLKGSFYHAGQVCVSIQRIFVHHSICKKLAQDMVKGAKRLIVGDPLDPKTEVGPLITSAEVDRIDSWVQEAIAGGAQLLCGGKRLSATCYQPTILLNPPEDVQVSQKEIFGPVVAIYSYDNYSDALRRANRPPFSFQAAVFTKNIDVALDAVHKLNGTTVMVNDSPTFRVDWMPFGGEKESGFQMGGIPYSMRDMSIKKMMVIKSKSL